MALSDGYADTSSSKNNNQGGDFNSSYLPRETYRDSPFYVRKGTSASVIYLDDHFIYDADKRKVLQDFADLRYGPISIEEHPYKAPQKSWQKKPSPFLEGFMTCSKGWAMTPALRVAYLADFGVLDRLGQRLLDDDDFFSRVIMAPRMDTDLLAQVLNEATITYLEDLLAVPLGGWFQPNGTCQACDMAFYTRGEKARDEKSGKEYTVRVFEGDIATPRAFVLRTVVSMKTFVNNKGETVVNPRTLFQSGSSSDRSMMEQKERDFNPRSPKKRPGLALLEYQLTRAGAGKSSQTGDAPGMCIAEWTPEDLAAEAPDAVLVIREETLRERLLENWGYKALRVKAMTGKSVDEAIAQLIQTFGEGAIVPKPLDYLQLVLPKTPRRERSLLPGFETFDATVAADEKAKGGGTTAGGTKGGAGKTSAAPRTTAKPAVATEKKAPAPAPASEPAEGYHDSDIPF